MEARQSKGNPGSRHIDPETWLRLKLITAFKGDVPRAEIALEFLKGNPEASEDYRRFKQWQWQKRREDNAALGIKTYDPISKEVR